MNGNARAVETLKQRLDSGEDVDLLSETDSCTVASLLKQYVRDLPEGLVDSTVQRALIHHFQGKTKYFLFVTNANLFSHVLILNTYVRIYFELYYQLT